jgi:hypothetical protein
MEQYKKLEIAQSFRITLGLFALLLLCTLIIYSLLKKISEKINMEDYSQSEELGGVSKHKITGKLFCTSCLLKNIPSPVRRNKHDWVCLSKDCIAKYPDPNNPPPLKQQRVIHPGVKNDS